jgi:chitinase
LVNIHLFIRYKTIISFLREYPVSGGLAGNAVSPADTQNYVLLLQELRQQLNAAGSADGKTYLLTAA